MKINNQDIQTPHAGQEGLKEIIYLDSREGRAEEGGSEAVQEVSSKTVSQGHDGVLGWGGIAKNELSREEK